MSFLNPLDALIPKIPFSFFTDFWVRVTSEAWGSDSVGVWGSRQLSPFWGGGSSQGAVSTPPPQIESPPARSAQAVAHVAAPPLHRLFLPPIEQDDVKSIYHEAQFELLSEHDYGFDTYFLNPGPGKRACMSLLDSNKYALKVQHLRTAAAGGGAGGGGAPRSARRHPSRMVVEPELCCFAKRRPGPGSFSQPGTTWGGVWGSCPPQPPPPRPPTWGGVWGSCPPQPPPPLGVGCGGPAPPPSPPPPATWGGGGGVLPPPPAPPPRHLGWGGGVLPPPQPPPPGH